MKKQYIFLIINLITNTLLWGQSPVPNLSSPHVYEMRRMGNIPVNLNAGQTNFSIDLLESLPELKKHLNLSVGYNSSGFQPNKPSNYAGLNWFINYGGVISRKNVGIADDYSTTESHISRGFWSLKNETDIASRLTNLDIFNGRYPRHDAYYGNYLFSNNSPYELTSDTYYFNFNNISGSFSIDINGDVILHSENPNLKIDLKNYTIQREGKKPIASEIMIADEFGNHYFFGGDIPYLEIRYQIGKALSRVEDISHHPRAPYTIDSWYLKEVKFANGINVKYEYNNFSRGPFEDYLTLNEIGSRYNDAPTNDSGLWLDQSDKYNYLANFALTTTQIDEKETNKTSNLLGTYRSSGFSYSNTEYFSVVRRLVPTKITSNFFTITFDYNFNKSTNNKILDYLTLKTINISTNNILLEKINFSHLIKENYPFLIEIESKNLGKFNFDYYYPSVLPKYPTRGVDYAGFWNGKSDTENSLLTSYNYNYDTGEYTILDDNRAENILLYNSTLLKKITYPTKGYSVFTYEPHYYSKKIENNIFTNFLRLPKNKNGSVGGARIRNIKNFSSSNELAEEKEYIYELNSDNTSNSDSKKTNSSGISYLDYNDTEFLKYSLKRGKTMFFYFKQVSYNLNEVTLDDNIIAYSEVSELKNNKLYKKYYFSDYLMIPDEIGTSEVKVNLDDTYEFYPDKHKNRFINVHVDNSFKRGKLIQEDSFNENKIQTSVLYSYVDLQVNTLNKNKFTPSVTRRNKEGHIFGYVYEKKNFSSYVLAGKTTKYFAGSGSNAVAEIYKYDSDKHNLLTSKETIYENNDHEVVKYKYALDSSSRFVHSNGSFNLNEQFNQIEKRDDLRGYFFIPDRMLFKNQISYLTSISRFKNSALLDEKVMLYSLSPKMYGQLYSELNKKKTNSELSIDLDPFMIYPVSNDEKQALNDRIKSSSLNQEYVIEKYDEFNNVLQYRDKSNIVTSFYYYNNLPVLKVVGKEYDANTDGFIYITLSENYFENFKRFIATFRTLDSYAEGYIHKPFVGVIEKIDARGNSTFYKYNESNRLESIKDSKGNVIQEFEYNFTNNN